MKIEFICSAVLPEHYPSSKVPEVALTGRSNAGKSSFLNALAHRKIAKVSNSPGKTRLLNFFSVGEKYRYVDMPGYGFASRSAKEIKSWREMIETYLSQRSCLVGLILVMDIRRDWSEDEDLIKEFVTKRSLSLGVVLNKSDKLKASAQKKQLEKIQKIMGKENVFLVSSFKKIGIKEVESAVFNRWVKNWQVSK